MRSPVRSPVNVRSIMFVVPETDKSPLTTKSYIVDVPLTSRVPATTSYIVVVPPTFRVPVVERVAPEIPPDAIISAPELISSPDVIDPETIRLANIVVSKVLVISLAVNSPATLTSPVKVDVPVTYKPVDDIRLPPVLISPTAVIVDCDEID